MFKSSKKKTENIEKKKFSTNKYIPKIIRRYSERHHFTEMWHKSREWLFAEKTVFDDKIYQEAGLVFLVLYNGKSVRNMGVIGQALGYSSCDASEVIWSRKAIRSTCDAMWAELRLEVIESNKVG